MMSYRRYTRPIELGRRATERRSCLSVSAYRGPLDAASQGRRACALHRRSARRGQKIAGLRYPRTCIAAFYHQPERAIVGEEPGDEPEDRSTQRCTTARYGSTEEIVEQARLAAPRTAASSASSGRALPDPATPGAHSDS